MDNTKEFNDLLEREPRRVYSIIANYFGEANVDIQFTKNRGGFMSLNPLDLLNYPISTIIDVLTPEQIAYFITLLSSKESPIRKDFTTEQLETIDNKIVGLLVNINKAKTEHVVSYFQFASSIVNHFIEKCLIQLINEGIIHYDLLTSIHNTSSYIFIKFPEVTLTNEESNQHTIKDLFVKIRLACNGKLMDSIEGTRSHYTFSEFMVSYRHSHLSSSYENRDLRRFTTFCLGDGPLIATTNTLKLDSNEVYWELFCSQLDSYVTIESLDGGPYIHMRDIPDGVNTSVSFDQYNYNCSSPIVLRDGYRIEEFMKFLTLNTPLQFVEQGGNVRLGYTPKERLRIFTNAYLEFMRVKYPSEPMPTNLLIPVRVHNNQVQRILTNRESSKLNVARAVNSECVKVLNFKGEDVFLGIELPEEANIQNIEGTFYVLNEAVLASIGLFINKLLTYDRTIRNSATSNYTKGRTAIL